VTAQPSRDMYDLADIGMYYDNVHLYETRPDVAFYVSEGRAAGGNVLEIGCGTGRVLIATARAGVSTTGVDRSKQMLLRCRENLAREPAPVRDRVQLVDGDMRSFDLGRTFDCVTIPFRPLQHLVDVSDQLACLSAVRRHLAPGGRFVFDVFNPDPRKLAAPSDEEVEDTPPTPLPDGRSFRRTSRVPAVHRAEQWSDVELAYYVTYPSGQTERVAQRFPMRWYTRWELEHLLARTGFAIRQVYGDFDRQPFSDDSAEIIVVAGLA
jgi:SAM-dependent methyltransferase